MTFDAETHQYHLNGKALPSVSEMCNLILGSSYDGIPKHILEQAANFGTAVHEAIEDWNENGVIRTLPPQQAHCLNEWIKLKGDIQVISSEIKGHYEGLFAGTFDMVGIENGKRYLYDFKTTSKFMDEKFALQLSLYRLIYGWDEIDGLKIVWLPKRSYGRIVDVKCWDKSELLNAVNEALFWREQSMEVN
jgi:hypothetical protein